jgi:hypothetical protein
VFGLQVYHVVVHGPEELSMLDRQEIDTIVELLVV